MGRGLGLLLAAALCLCGCAGSLAATSPPRLPAVAPSVSTGRFGATKVTLITDGATAANRMRDLINAATATVDVEIYEFDRTDLADALIAARGRGVRVRVIEDPSVEVNAATSARLRQAGVEVLIFPVQARQIDHVKLLIIDSGTAIFGGMNWGSTSWRNHDFDLAVGGRAVGHLASIFAADVVRSGGHAALGRPPADPEGLRLLATYPAAEVRPVVIDEISSARRQIFIEMYVMTDSEVIAALSAAARRGVAVFILFDPNQDLNQLAAARLRDAGVNVRFYRTQGEKLHAKCMEVDGQALVVGSANWTSSGFLHNHELDAAIDSPALATMALARMEADWKASGG